MDKQQTITLFGMKRVVLIGGPEHKTRAIITAISAIVISIPIYLLLRSVNEDIAGWGVMTASIIVGFMGLTKRERPSS